MCFFYDFQTRIPQELHRPMAVGTPNLSHVQNGHIKTLRIRGQCNTFYGNINLLVLFLETHFLSVINK